LRTPNSVKKTSKSQVYLDDFDLNLGSTKWAPGDQISGMTSAQDSASSSISSEEPASFFDSLNQRKRAPTITNPIKKPNNPNSKRQGTPKLKEIVRRKSCYCSECGGQSELEKKTVYIPQNHKFPQMIQQKIDEAKTLSSKTPKIKAINRFTEMYNGKRVFSPLGSKRKENKSLQKFPSNYSTLSKKGSAYEDNKSTPKAEERRPSAFNKLAEAATPKGASSEGGFGMSMRKFSELEGSMMDVDKTKSAALSLVRLQSYHSQEVPLASGLKTPGSTNKSSGFSVAWDLQEAASRNNGDGGLSKFGKKDKILRAATHQHHIPRSPKAGEPFNLHDTLPAIHSVADGNMMSPNHKRRDSYLSVNTPHERSARGNNRSVGNLTPSDFFENNKTPVPVAIQEEPVQQTNHDQELEVPSVTCKDGEPENPIIYHSETQQRANKHKILITKKLHSGGKHKYISISQRASPGRSPMPAGSSEVNHSTLNDPGNSMEGFGTLRVNTANIKKAYFGFNYSQPNSPGESFRGSHVKTLSVTQLEEKLKSASSVKKQKGNKKNAKSMLKITINNNLPLSEPQKTLLSSSKNQTLNSPAGTTWRYNSVSMTPKLFHALEKQPILSGKEKMMIETYSPKLKEKFFTFKVKGSEKPGTRGKSSTAKISNSTRDSHR